MSAASPPPLPSVVRTYGRWSLDCLVDLAHAISHDYVARPRHYRHIPDDIAEVLSRFRFSTGSDPAWPNGLQRAASYHSLMGPLCQRMASLRASAISVAKSTPGEGSNLLRRAFIDEIDSTRPSLPKPDGNEISAQERSIQGIFDNAVRVLTCKQVAEVFGLPPAPGDGWPMNGHLDGDAAYLCEEIDKRLMRLGTAGTMTQQKFLVLQRVARFGAQTISETHDEPVALDDVERIDIKVQSAYSWATALRDLLPGIDIVRAWKDQDYRLRLTNVERELLPPNPAGSIELEGTELDEVIAAGRFAMGATSTVAGEVCCCTGDFCDDDPTDPDPNPGPSPGTNIGFTCPPWRCKVVIA